jgi:hypothetical protein
MNEAWTTWLKILAQIMGVDQHVLEITSFADTIAPFNSASLPLCPKSLDGKKSCCDTTRTMTKSTHL